MSICYTFFLLKLLLLKFGLLWGGWVRISVCLTRQVKKDGEDNLYIRKKKRPR